MKRFFYRCSRGLGAAIVFFVAFVGMTPERQPGPRGPVVLMKVESAITPATDDYLKSVLQQATARDARLVVMTLNTPGGVLTSTQAIVEQLLAAPVPTAVFVSPAGGSATSAGVFITLAANFAVMAPGTTIGAAHPVSGAGEDVQGDMRKKIENFAASHIKAIAEQRGRNVTWAEKAVRESVSITDREAEKEKVIDFIANDLTDLLRQLEGRVVTIQGKPVTLHGLSGAPLERVEMSFRQRLVNFLSDPNIAILLGLAAMLGLGVEFYNPGLLFPGICGAICLILALVAGQVIPINYGGLVLLLLGVIFFVIEMVAPSFGLWGGAGVVSIVLGSIYFVDTNDIWTSGGLEVNHLLVGSAAVAVGCLMMLLGYIALQSRRLRVTVGAEGLIGQVGVVKEWVGGDSGRVFLAGELWRARMQTAGPLEVGSRIRVIGKDADLRLIVERVE